MRDLDAIVHAKCVRVGVFRPVPPTHVRPHFQKHFSEKSGIFLKKKIQGSKVYTYLIFLLPALCCKMKFFLMDMGTIRLLCVCLFVVFIKNNNAYLTNYCGDAYTI